jgi:hypothetical protein
VGGSNQSHSWDFAGKETKPKRGGRPKSLFLTTITPLPCSTSRALLSNQTPLSRALECHQQASPTNRPSPRVMSKSGLHRRPSELPWRAKRCVSPSSAVILLHKSDEPMCSRSLADMDGLLDALDNDETRGRSWHPDADRSHLFPLSLLRAPGSYVAELAGSHTVGTNASFSLLAFASMRRWPTFDAERAPLFALFRAFPRLSFFSPYRCLCRFLTTGCDVLARAISACARCRNRKSKVRLTSSQPSLAFLRAHKGRTDPKTRILTISRSCCLWPCSATESYLLA